MMATKSRQTSKPSAASQRALIKRIISLALKRDCRDANEFSTKCPPQIYQEILLEAFPYQNSVIATALDIARQLSADMQRRSMWGWMEQKCIMPTEENFNLLSSLFQTQQISPLLFAQSLKSILTRQDPKINTLRLVGAANSCKSLLVQAIGSIYNTAFMSNSGSGSDFYFNDCIGRNLIILEEVFITPQTVDDFKSVLSGYTIGVNIKQQPRRQILKDTPILMTSNHIQFGKGFLSGIDESALSLRCRTFNFPHQFKPTSYISPTEICGYFVKLLRDEQNN